MAKRNIAHLILVTALTALTADAGVFPPSEGDLAASIPFSFQVEDVVMSAGEYVIRVDEQGRMQVCEDGVYCAALTIRDSRVQGKDQNLVFVTSDSQLRLVGIGESEPNVSESGAVVPTHELCIHNDAGGLGVIWH